MRPVEPSQLNQIQLYRPHCMKCGSFTQLARIEPCDTDPDHDLRTFECTACGNPHVVKIRFR